MKSRSEQVLAESKVVKSKADMLAKDVGTLKQPYDDLGDQLKELRKLKEKVKAKLKAVTAKFPVFEKAKEIGSYSVPFASRSQSFFSMC